MTASQLKNAIFQYAVQGKLVPQNPNDEPASVLLEKIRKERKTLIKAGKIKSEKLLLPITEEEIPFEIPKSWEWVRLGFLCDFGNCNNIEAEKIDSSSWLLDLEDIEKDSGVLLQKKRKCETCSFSTKHCFYKGQVLYSKLRPYLNKVIIADENGYSTSEILPLDFGFFIFNRYAQIYLMSPFFVEYATQCSYGVKMPRVGTDDGKKALFPLPPLDEQKRIVERIEELLSLVNEYDKAERTLTTLDNEFPEKLKKSVLQSAIHGKLIPQDSNDEPAGVLLERIRTEKKKLIKEGKIKPNKEESIIFRRDNSHYEKREKTERCIDDEIPFEIPESWAWVRLGEICSYIQRGKSPKYSLIKKYPVIAQKCNQWAGLDIEKVLFIDPESLSSYNNERILQTGDLLWNSTGLGTLGRMVLYNTKLNPYELAVADSHVTVIRPINKFIDPIYLYFYFSNPTVQTKIEEQSDGSTKQKELATTTIINYLLPLPPFEEQKRIVDKIEKLLSNIPNN